MRFEGRVYFDFASADTWHFYRLLAAAAGQGVDLALSWVPYLERDEAARLHALAAFAAVSSADPARHGAFLQSMLELHHREGAPLGVESSLAAARAAEVAPDVVATAWQHEAPVRAATAQALALGVTASPTLYRHGPVMHVRVNPAALTGDVVGRLGLIDAVLGDDGIWAMVKP